jgi:hypothetical protein
MKHICAECAKAGVDTPAFKTAGALGSHRARTHGTAGSSRKNVSRRKKGKRKYTKRGSKRELTLREVVKAFVAERDDLTRMLNRLETLL